jgi:hypothetical protein
MNEIDLLHRLRAEVPEPDEGRMRAAEARLTAAVRAPRGRRSAGAGAGFRLRPVLWRAGLAGGLAAAVALGLALGAGPGSAPDGGPGGTAPAEANPVSAVELLDRAALAAERTPELNPRPDQFLVYESVTMHPAIVVGNGEESRFLYRTKRKIWLSVDGTREGALSSEWLAPQPYPGWPIPAQAQKDVGKVGWRPLPICGQLPDNARRDYLYLRTLPTDPEQMLAVLRSRNSGDPDRDRRAWTAIGDMLRESYLPPAQRAALFRAAKLIPGVTVVEAATDAVGSVGIAVARVDDEQGVRYELIFDPETYLFQGERSFVVHLPKVKTKPVPSRTGDANAAPVPAPTGATASAAPTPPVGSLLSVTAELSVTVADEAPRVPHDEKTCG